MLDISILNILIAKTLGVSKKQPQAFVLYKKNTDSKPTFIKILSNHSRRNRLDLSSLFVTYNSEPLHENPITSVLTRNRKILPFNKVFKEIGSVIICNELLIFI